MYRKCAAHMEDLSMLMLLFSFGITFIGDLFSEQQLLKYAYAFEQRTQARRKGQPIIAPHTELAQDSRSWFG